MFIPFTGYNPRFQFLNWLLHQKGERKSVRLLPGRIISYPQGRTTVCRPFLLHDFLKWIMAVQSCASMLHWIIFSCELFITDWIICVKSKLAHPGPEHWSVISDLEFITSNHGHIAPISYDRGGAVPGFNVIKALGNGLGTNGTVTTATESGREPHWEQQRVWRQRLTVIRNGMVLPTRTSGS
jgi:hypothetical protein